MEEPRDFDAIEGLATLACGPIREQPVPPEAVGLVLAALDALRWGYTLARTVGEEEWPRLVVLVPALQEDAITPRQATCPRCGSHHLEPDGSCLACRLRVEPGDFIGSGG